MFDQLHFSTTDYSNCILFLSAGTHPLLLGRRSAPTSILGSCARYATLLCVRTPNSLYRSILGSPVGLSTCRCKIAMPTSASPRTLPHTLPSPTMPKFVSPCVLICTATTKISTTLYGTALPTLLLQFPSHVSTSLSTRICIPRSMLVVVVCASATSLARSVFFVFFFVLSPYHFLPRSCTRTMCATLLLVAPSPSFLSSFLFPLLPPLGFLSTSNPFAVFVARSLVTVDPGLLVSNSLHPSTSATFSIFLLSSLSPHPLRVCGTPMPILLLLCSSSMCNRPRSNCTLVPTVVPPRILSILGGA
uniref:Uncharacterized protein n=1 Tax=Lygus hesperus TaxID=30085 RepID=A0A0A9Y4Q8_LYGHE